MSRITPSTILLGFVALLLAFAGTYVLRQSLKAKPAEAKAAAPETITVPLASADLQSGRELTLGDIALVKLKRGELKQRDIKQFMSNPDQIIGRVLKVDAVRGKAFDTSMFYPEGLGPSIEERLTPGRRAVTIPVLADGAVLGFARAGSFVDVLFRAEPEDDLPEATVTIAEFAEVLALGQETYAATQRTEAELGSELAVTLSVTPAQAAALRIALGRGTLSLAIRSPEDAAAVEQADSETAPATLDDIMGYPHQPDTINTYRGTSLKSIKFDRKGKRRSGGNYTTRRFTSTNPPELTAPGNSHAEVANRDAVTRLTN